MVRLTDEQATDILHLLSDSGLMPPAGWSIARLFNTVNSLLQAINDAKRKQQEEQE